MTQPLPISVETFSNPLISSTVFLGITPMRYFQNPLLSACKLITEEHTYVMSEMQVHKLEKNYCILNCYTLYY